MDALFELLSRIYADSNPGRFAESLVLLAIAWWRVKATMTAHLSKIETSLESLTKAVTEGFAAGEKRFSVIEGRLIVLELGGNKPARYENKGELNGTN